MESKNPVFCADCSRLMLFHPALGRYICVACVDLGAYERKVTEDFFDTVNNAWEYDKL